MSNIKITQLPALDPTPLAGTDVFPVVSGNVTYQVTANAIAAFAGGSANTGNVTFDDNIILGTGDEFGGDGLYLAPGPGSIANSAVQYLRVRGGDYPTHIHLDTGNNSFYDQYFGADDKFVKLEANGNVVINANDSAGNTATWTFDIAGNLNTPQGGYIGPAGVKGDGTMLTGGLGQLASLTSYYADAPGIYAGCFTANPDGTVNITTYGNGTGQLGQWTFSGANLTIPGTITAPNDETINIQALDNDGLVSSVLTLNPNDTLTELRGYSSQDSNSWTDADWSTGVYTTESGGTVGAIQFTGAASIIDFVDSLPNPEYVFVQVNGGPLLPWGGTSSSSNNITFYTDVLPGTDPTTVTSFAYYYSLYSSIGIDYDTNELLISTNDADIIVETSGTNDISINSARDLSLSGNGSMSLTNNSSTDGIDIITNNIASGQVWNYGNTGILTLPGEGVIQSNNDTIILQSKDTGTGNIYSLRVGTNGGLYFASTEYPGGWLDITNDAGNANITSSISSSGAAGYNLNLKAGATNQGVFTSLPGGDLNLAGGTGGYADDGIGGAGGDVNITAGAPGEPGNVAGNITVNTGTNTWNFDNTGNLSLPGNTFSVNYANGTPVTFSGGSSVAEAPFSIQSADFNVTIGNRYGIATGGGSVTATLPASPTTGDAVYFADAAGAYSTNAFIVSPNGGTIMGVSGSMTVTTDGQSFGLFFNGSTWRTYS